MPVQLTAYPFESQAVGEGQYGALADLWLATGVVRHQLQEMQVFADSSGMQVKIRDGRAVVRGVFVENSTQQTLPLAGANASLPRKDLVVVRVDYANNRVDLDVKTGTPAASPAIPSLTRTGLIWETGLADVLVDAAAVTIAAGKVTDRRADQSYFGWAANRFPCTGVLSSAKPSQWPEGGLIYLTDTDVLEINVGSFTVPSWAIVYPQSFTAAGTPTDIQPDDVAASGVGTSAARIDHKHGIIAATPVTQAYNDVAAEGTAGSFARSDHRHGMPASGAISFGSPGSSAVGDAVADGVAGTAARSDHKHGREAFGVPALTFGIANSAGAAPSPIRSDASIALFDATAPASLTPGAAAAAGSAGVAARRDHIHALASVPETTILTRNMVGANVACPQASGEVDVWLYNVLGGTLSTDRMLRLTLEGQIENFTGFNLGITLKLYYGATRLGATKFSSIPSAGGFALQVMATLAAHNATNAQRALTRFMLGGSSSVGAPPPATLVTPFGEDLKAHATVGEDSTLTKALKLTGEADGLTLNVTYFHVLIEKL